MEQVYITSERLKRLKKEPESVHALEGMCRCKLRIEEGEPVEISGKDAYGEFVAKNILQAYGRGFEMKTAMLLVNEDYYFSSIDLGVSFGSEKRIHQMKSRIIGEDGRTKNYIESVSGARLSVYGDTVSFIGTHSQINEAETAVNTLVEGGTHKLAYLKMEAAHRKNKASSIDFGKGPVVGWK